MEIDFDDFLESQICWICGHPRRSWGQGLRTLKVYSRISVLILDWHVIFGRSIYIYIFHYIHISYEHVLKLPLHFSHQRCFFSLPPENFCIAEVSRVCSGDGALILSTVQATLVQQINSYLGIPRGNQDFEAPTFQPGLLLCGSAFEGGSVRWHAFLVGKDAQSAFLIVWSWIWVKCMLFVTFFVHVLLLLLKIPEMLRKNCLDTAVGKVCFF